MPVDLEKIIELFPNGVTAAELRAAGFPESDIAELERLQVQRLIDKLNAMGFPPPEYTEEEEKKVFPVGPKKRTFTKRENELERLVRKRGLKPEQIFERSEATIEEILWMWQRDRSELFSLKRVIHSNWIKSKSQPKS